MPSHSITQTTEFYTVYTLFDITPTGVVRNYSPNKKFLLDAVGQQLNTDMDWQRSRNQQRNLQSLIQIISLRTQPMIEEVKCLFNQDLDKYQFGKNYIGKATVWMMSFASEISSVFKLNDNPVGTLQRDANGVPIVLNLTESVSMEFPTIDTETCSLNCYFVMNNYAVK